jgi:hypothetical protein
MSRIRRGLVLVTLAVPLVAATLSAQLTVPERTNGERTSTHAEVLAYIDSLQAHGAKLLVGTLGESPQGKRLPYVILSRPQVTTPAQAHATGKPIFYIEGNIHAGEVEGKEAVQALMRDLTLGKLKPLLDSVIILFVPIYNADGNDAFGHQDINRGEQVGPEMVGLRANGQGYDLNRDYVKQDAPETRASLAFVARWDPDLFMDLHTTDGSYHGYALTWSPGLNSNRTPTNSWVQDTVLEQVRKRLQVRDHVETYPYGNFRGGATAPTGWDTYEGLPRYGTNLAGMTRISILSEAMSHDPFPRRIEATYDFILESIRYLNENKVEMRRHEALTAKYRPDSVVVRGNVLGSSPSRMDTVLVAVTRTITMARSDSATRANTPRTPQHHDTVGVCVAGAGRGGRGGGGRNAGAPPAAGAGALPVAGAAGGAGRGAGGARGGGGRGAAAGGTTRDVQEATGEVHPTYMEVHDRFAPVLKQAIPAAYVFGSEWSKVVELMRRQGIEVRKTTAAWTGSSGHFAIDTLIHAGYFEGHCGMIVDGKWTPPSADTIPAGSFVVPTNQRMGMLASFLLEPSSEDGYTYWNFFDAGTKQGSVAPVRRLVTMPALKMAAVP